MIYFLHFVAYFPHIKVKLPALTLRQQFCMFIHALKKTSFCISILFLFTQCQSGFILHEKITDNYYIIAPGIYERAALCFQTKDDWANYGEVVPATVFAVGYNDQYIIIKQHPLLSFTNAVDKSTTNYYNKHMPHYQRVRPVLRS